MDKIACKTADFGEENAAKLIKLFPECEGERGTVDLEKLRQVLSSSVVEGDVERYQFTWPGKRKAMAAANAATTKTLRPAISESVGRDGTAGKFDSENLYIEGDNLEALKLLQCNYAGKVKMIYIDPPYNTGHDFVYRDRFSLTDKELAKEGGAFDEDGNRFEKNDSAEARYHSNWCSMMYPRLKLARNLLRDDGVLFMSIDDNEVVNARKLCDEVFGARNYIDCITVINNMKGRSDSEFFATCNEYLIVVAKQCDKFKLQGFSISEEEIEDDYKFEDEIGKYKPIALRKTGNGWQREERPYMFYPILYKDGLFSLPNQEELTKLYDAKNLTFDDDALSAIEYKYHNKGFKIFVPKDEKGNFGRWRWGIETFMREKDHNITINKAGGLCSKMRANIEDGSVRMKTAKTVFYRPEYDTGSGSKVLDSLFSGKKFFENPKSLTYITDLFSLVAGNDNIVLDFFSGSATTAHAVMQLNAEDGGNRKFILVQLPEVCAEDSEAAKAGYKNICEIGKERIRRAGKKIVEELAAKNAKVAKEVNESMPDLFRQDLQDSQDLGGGDNLVNPVNPVQNNSNIDVGFRVLKIDSSSLNDVSATVGETNQMMFDKLERIKSDRTPEDILFQLLIETHIPLSDPIAKVKVGGNEVFFVGVDTDESLRDSASPRENYMDAPLVACLDRSAKLTNEFFLELAAFKPGIAFFRDDAFNDDAARINVEQIFKQNSPNTIVKVI